MDIISLAVLVAVLIAREVTAYFERAAWSRERSELLTRIQAPEKAPALLATPPEVRKAAVQRREEDDTAAEQFALVGAILPETGEES